MRGRVTVLVALVAGILAVTPAAAQQHFFAGHPNLEGQFGLELSGGTVVPLGQLGDIAVLTPRPIDTGLDAHRGWNGHAGGDFYMTSFMAAGLWIGQNTLNMRDQVLPSADGNRAYANLARCTTTMVGLRVKGYLPMQGSWSPYAALGVTHFARKVELSHQLAPVDPAAPIYDITDNRMGFDLGAGFEYRVTSWIGMGLGTTYYYSGEFEHDLPWMGSERIVRNWEFWSLDARLTVHVPGMQAK